MSKISKVSPPMTVRVPTELRRDFRNYCRKLRTKEPELVREMIRDRIYPKGTVPAAEPQPAEIAS